MTSASFQRDTAYDVIAKSGRSCPSGIGWIQDIHYSGDDINLEICIWNSPNAAEFLALGIKNLIPELIS